MTEIDKQMVSYLEGLRSENPGCMFYVDPDGPGRITLTWARRPDPAMGLFDNATDAVAQARAQTAQSHTRRRRK